MIVFVYLILTVASLVYLWVKKKYQFFANLGFHSSKGVFPFGSLKGVGTIISPFQATEAVYKEFKGKAKVAGFYSFLSPTILPIDPEFIKNILVRDFNSFHDRGFYYNKKDDPTSANLLSLEGQEWRDRRLKLSSIFTSGKIKMMFDTVDSIGDKMVNVVDEILKGSDSLDMREIAARFTSDVIGNVAFGLECKCLDDPNSEIYKHARKLSHKTTYEIFRFFFSMGFPNLSRKLHIPLNPEEPSKFFLNAFLQTLDLRVKNEEKRNDFVSLLLGLKEFYTPTELAAESFLVFGAGAETSSTLISFICYELALNLEIQKKLRNEIVAGIEGNDGKLTYDLLFNFKYLDMVVSEGLRKYPPIPRLLRQATKSYLIPGTNLEILKGTSIEIPTFALHYDPEHYPDPQKFDPQRFTPENTKSRNTFTYLPFGDGPRNCIGMRFGLMQSKLGIVKLITNFEMSPMKKTTIPMKFVPSTPLATPVGGIFLQLKKIDR